MKGLHSNEYTYSVSLKSLHLTYQWVISLGEDLENYHVYIVFTLDNQISIIELELLEKEAFPGLQQR